MTMHPVECICTLSRRCARALTDIYDRALAPSGLKVTQYSLLRAIGRVEIPTLTGIAETTGLERSTLGRNLRVLEKSGMITLSSGDDERTRVAALTDKARKALRQAEPRWQQVQEQMRSVLPKDVQKQLKLISEALEKMD